MERRVRIALAGVLMTFAMISATGCTTEKQKEAAKETPQQTEHDAEENGYGKPMQAEYQEPEQTPEDKDNQESEDDAKEIKENRFRPLMEAAIDAIERDDAKKLFELQESEEAKELSLSIRDGGQYIYFPDEEDSSKGIGLYTFKDCSCRQWYYGDYKNGEREGKGIWYYVSDNTKDGSLYKEVYDGSWSKDVPNGKGRQLIALGDSVDTDKKFKVKNGLFYGTYKIKDKLQDGTVVRGKYKLKKGKYVTISDEELAENNFAVPDEPHLAIAFLYDENGVARSCSMVYAEDDTKGVKHFYPSE